MASFETEKEEGSINSTALQNIGGTIIWLKVTSICNFISQGLSAFMTVLLVTSGRGNAGGGVVGIMIGIYLALKLWQQAAALEQYVANSNSKDFDESLTQEAAYWSTLGVLFIIATIAVVVFAFALFLNPDMFRGLDRLF